MEQKQYMTSTKINMQIHLEIFMNSLFSIGFCCHMACFYSCPPQPSPCNLHELQAPPLFPMFYLQACDGCTLLNHYIFHYILQTIANGPSNYRSSIRWPSQYWYCILSNLRPSRWRMWSVINWSTHIINNKRIILSKIMQDINGSLINVNTILVL